MPKSNISRTSVYTTTYDDFRGVDFTNDPSNVWKHRSPSGKNMLPDSAGTPYKRFGWKTEIPSSQLIDRYCSDNEIIEPDKVPKHITVNKLYYFTLKGIDHLFIFSNIGVFIFRQLEDGTEELNTSRFSYEEAIINSYNRAFFFEGDGESAFYIYGNFKMWRYRYDTLQSSQTYGKFLFEEIEPYIPTVNISVDAKHESGESHEAVNLLSGYVAESFRNNLFRTGSVTPHSTSSGITATVIDQTTLTSMITEPFATFTYSDATWKIGGDEVSISTYGISVGGNPMKGDTIDVSITDVYKIALPKQYVSSEGLTVTNLNTGNDFTWTTGQLTVGKCKLVTDGGVTYIMFYNAITADIDGEDAIKVTYPRDTVDITSKKITATQLTVTA